jgi:hypothetical protein
MKKISPSKPKILTYTLTPYKEVFDEPQGLPPQRSADYQIILKPHTTPVNQRSYV